MKIRLIFAVAIALVFFGGLHSQTLDEQHAISAWRSIEQTKGGGLLAIKSLLVEYAAVTRVEVFPGKTWEFGYQLDGKTPDLKISNSGKEQYCDAHGVVEVRDVTSDTEAFRQRLAFLLETTSELPRPVRISRESSGRHLLDVIETEVGSSKVDFAYEPEEMLVREVRFFDSKGKLWSTYLLSDYAKVDGIEMPQTFSTKSELLRIISPPTHLTFTFNVAYNPTIFSAACKATDSNAWKSEEP